MSERVFRYRVEVDNADVARAAAETRRAFAQEMNRVPIGGPVGSPGAGGLLGDMGKLRSFLAGGIAGYGLTQLGQVALQLGQLGAANLRTQKSFEGLAEGASLASDVLLNRLRNATQNTVTSQRLMASTNMLLVSAQNGQIDVTEKQIETLARFARLRSTQLGISTEEAYNRLIFGTVKRETELLDELGISTKGLADIIGVPVQNINKDVNSLLRAIVQVAEADVAKFGDPVLDEAAKIEDAMNQMAESWDKLAVAAAEPVAFTLTFTAQALQEAQGSANNIQAVWDQIINNPRQGIKDLLGESGLMSLGNTVFGRRDAGAQNRELIDAYQRLGDTQSAAFRNYPTPFGTEGGPHLQKITGLVRGLSDAYLELSRLQTAGIFDPGTLNEAESAWNAITAGVQDGSLELDDANGKVRELLGLLRSVVDEAANFGPALTRSVAAIHPFASVVMDNWANRARADAVVAGQVGPGELTEDERKFRLAVGDTEEQIGILEGNLARLVVGTDEWYGVMSKILGLREQADAQDERTRQEIRDRRAGLLNAQLGYQLTQTDTTGQIALLQAQADTLTEGTEEWFAAQERIANLQIRAAETAETEWKRSAREVERMFEQAADKIMGIPGVTSLTPVTERDMADAELGIYRDKPDEWVRRVRDELLNKNDYADVELGQVARLAGLPGDMPPEALISRLEDRWTSGSLFADPANLSLLNMDAIRAQYNEMQAGQQGRANQRQYIMEQLGLSQADAALLTGQQAPIVQMLTGGMSTDEIAGQLEGLGSTITERVLLPLQSGGMVRTLADSWAVDVQTNVHLLYGPVDSLASAVTDRLGEKIGSGLGIVDVVVARVLEEIADDL